MATKPKIVNHSAKDKHGNYPIHTAVINSDIGLIQQYNLSSEQLSAKNSAGMTPLHLSAMIGNVDIWNYLIAHGANVFIVNNAHYQPIQLQLLAEPQIALRNSFQYAIIDKIHTKLQLYRPTRDTTYYTICAILAELKHHYAIVADQLTPVQKRCLDQAIIGVFEFHTIHDWRDRATISSKIIKKILDKQYQILISMIYDTYQHAYAVMESRVTYRRPRQNSLNLSENTNQVTFGDFETVSEEPLQNTATTEINAVSVEPVFVRVPTVSQSSGSLLESTRKNVVDPEPAQPVKYEFQKFQSTPNLPLISFD